MLWGHKAPLCRLVFLVGRHWPTQCGAVVYAPPLRLDCRVLAGPAVVR
jgi:hypothetical protein